MTGDQNERMRIDNDIEAALKVLGEMQPPGAIVSRVHRRLEIAAALQARSWSRGLVIPVAAVSMAAVVLVVIFTQVHHTPENQRSAVQTARLVANTPLAQAAIAPPSAPVAIKSSGEGKRPVRVAVARRRRQGGERRHAANLLSYPLTRQEKLLLQFSRNAKPADLQALNPEYQARVEAQQEAEFAAYLKSGDDSSTQETAN